MTLSVIHFFRRGSFHNFKITTQWQITMKYNTLEMIQCIFLTSYTMAWHFWMKQSSLYVYLYNKNRCLFNFSTMLSPFYKILVKL